ncbi:Rpn family recombination-promoting nuclease/putative transposase [Desulfococcaceae bacterium HSG8]|nr:Rpn family recombination-promoting nuclease/putative transposase [Desulfococcaceae bacterium HSG8]
MEIYLYNDVAFKWTFGRQERTTPLISLLNAVVGEPLFREIRVMNPFDISKYPEDKMGILDLRVKEAGSGIWADVEMQVAYQEYYPERSMFYLAGLYRDQLRAGEDYPDLRPCYGVHILMADLLEDEPDWYNCYRMTNVKSNRLLSGHWNLYYLELRKFREAMKEGGVSWKKLEQWCGFLSEPHDPSEALDENFRDNEGIKEVHEMLQEFTEDERLRERYRLHQAWLRDQRSVERERMTERRLRREAEAEKKKAEDREKKMEAGKKKAEDREKKMEAGKKKAEDREKKMEAEKKKAEDREKKMEANLKERERRSVLALREEGYPDERIAEMLEMPEDKVKAIGNEFQA